MAADPTNEKRARDSRLEKNSMTIMEFAGRDGLPPATLGTYKLTTKGLLL